MLLFPTRVAAIGAALILCGFVDGAMAQTPAKAPAATAAPAAAATTAAPVAQKLTVMVVDVQQLLQSSDAAKMVRSQIEAKRAEYAKEISRQEEVLRQERDALQRQQASLSPAALSAKGREFQAKVNELDRNVQGKRQALERSNSQALEKIQNVMLRIIANIAKQRKANLVFQRAELVLFDQSFDVTDEVLAQLNQQLPSLTVSFATPVTPAAPVAAKPATTRSRRR
jgi:Skp family chaperone for outer membrane proteins